jgi:FMN phosphatase YigB (HAD superfamily)
MRRIFLLLFLVLGVEWFQAWSITDTTVVNFNSVETCVNRKIKQYGSSEVLIVLDIDNTLLTSHVDLGGDIWYQWQTGKLDLKPTEKQKIKKCFYEDAIGLLYELGTMDLTDTLIPVYIRKWQDEGATVFALTSRSPETRAPTERELRKNGIDLSRSALKTIDGNRPIYIYTLERKMSYFHGIMMTTGMNKGKMLTHILGRTGRTFKAIIFVDDSEKNIKDVFQSFKNNPETDVTLFHYDKVIAERKKANGGMILTPQQAEKMAQDWEKLNSMLQSIFPGRTTEDGCVNRQ